MSGPTRKQVALHEAAHAVVSYVLGFEHVEARVFVDSTGSLNGHHQFIMPRKPTAAERRRRAASALAGCLVERGALPSEEQYDWWQAVKFAPTTRQMNAALKLAHDTVLVWNVEIRKVADALARRGFVGKSAMSRLMRGAEVSP